MSIDVPDYSRGIVAAQVLVGQSDGSDEIVTVTLPATTTVLWLWYGPEPDPAAPTVTGVTTGITYPALSFLPAADDGNFPFLIPVAPLLDSQVAIQLTPGPRAWVIADTSLRVVVNLPLYPYGT